jgi:hypothetical protein
MARQFDTICCGQPGEQLSAMTVAERFSPSAAVLQPTGGSEGNAQFRLKIGVGTSDQQKTL